ncbi:hypothetical protein N9288_00460 [bacterium]|nr:hypothetical protein [bacterium]
MVRTFKKKQSSGICLHPSGSCTRRSIRSHTISKSASLSLLAEKGKVLVWEGDLWAKRKKGVLSLKAKGVNLATTFPGFCKDHDSSLFSHIDATPFEAKPEQLFEQTLRSVSREFFAKQRAIEILEKQQRSKKLRSGASPLETMELNQMLEASLVGQNLGLKDVLEYRQQLHKMWKEKSFEGLRHCVVKMEGPLQIAVAAAFTPDYNPTGEKIQDLSDFTAAKSLLGFSAIPSENYTYFVMSWHQDAEPVLSDYVASIINAGDLEKRLLWMAFSQSENVAIKPSWWKGVPEISRFILEQAMSINADPSNPLSESSATFPDDLHSDWVNAQIL